MYGWVFASENSIPVIPEEEEGAKEGTGVEFRQMLNIHRRTGVIVLDGGADGLGVDESNPYRASTVLGTMFIPPPAVCPATRSGKGFDICQDAGYSG